MHNFILEDVQSTSYENDESANTDDNVDDDNDSTTGKFN